MTNFTLRKAERKQARLRVGLFGPSGSGKTMSALKLARGIAEWNKIAVIDTENNSADLYSHLGEYNVLNIEAPFTPEKYVEAIRACEQAEMEVIIIDSITHEWAGTGGVLEMVDELGKVMKNPMQAWAKMTPRHNKFIQGFLESTCHIICCGRSKQDYVMNQIEKNGRTINVPEKVGLKAVTREGFDYEMTISFDLAINHYAETSKDRTGVFMDRPGFKISEDTGKEMLEWNKSGAVDTVAQKKEIMRQLKRIGLNINVEREQVEADIIDLTGLSLQDKNFDKIITKLRDIKPMSNEEISQKKEKEEISKEMKKGNSKKDEAKNENKEVEEKKEEKKEKKEEPVDLIKPFQLQTIKKLAKEKIKAEGERDIKTFLVMFGLDFEELKTMTSSQANTAIKLIQSYQDDDDLPGEEAVE